MGEITKTTKKRKRTPAKDPVKREGQLINLAINLAEEQLLNGTATSQVITHFLKLATTKEQLENEKLRADLRVAEAKVKHMESQSTSQELYEKALAAFTTYAGRKNNSNEENEDDIY